MGVTILQIAASGNEKSKCFLNRVLLASIVHIYSELYVNPLKNKDMGAEKLFMHFRIHASSNERKMKYFWFLSCDNTFWSLYWNQHHFSFHNKGDSKEKLFCAIEGFFARANEKIKNLNGQVFSSVNMHLYSKYEANTPRNKVVGAKKRFCAYF